MKEELIILSESQQALIRDSFLNGATPNLSDLTKLVFDDDSLDGRSKQGRVVKEYIAKFNIGTVKVNVIKKTESINLTEEQKNIIFEEYSKPGFSSLNLARVLFGDDNLSPLHKEHRAVNEYVNFLRNKDFEESLNLNGDGEFKSIIYNPSSNLKRPDVPREQYRPPANIMQTIARVNKYMNLSWREDELKRSQIKCVESLLSYLKVFRFLYQINTYSRSEDRELFEDAFIRYTHDKDDLTQEELDQFITLSNEVVIAADIQRRIEYLRISLDEMASESDGKKISMSLNEAINNAQTEYNQCISRQDKLYKSLTVNRSKRIDEKRNENASILNLVYAWKQEENRQKMIALAERQRESLKEEVDKLSSVDEFKALIRGIDPKEIFNT